MPAGYKSALPRQHGTSGLKSAVTSYNYSKLDKSWGWYNLIVECQRKQPGPKGSQSIICKAQRGTKPSETVYIPAHWFIFVYDERSCDYHPHILLQLWNVQSQREQGYRFIYCLQIWCSLSFNPVIHHNLLLMALGMAFTRQRSTTLNAVKSHLEIIIFSAYKFVANLE